MFTVMSFLVNADFNIYSSFNDFRLISAVTRTVSAAGVTCAQSSQLIFSVRCHSVQDKSMRQNCS